MPNARPRKPRVWRRPLHIEREYTTELVAIAQQVEDAVRAEVYPVLAQLRQDAVEDIPEAAGWFESLRQGFLRASARINLSGVPAMVRRYAERVSAFNSDQFHSIVRAAYGVDVLVTEPWLAGVLKNWESENIRLIRSIPAQALDRMHGKIVSSVRAGRLVPDLRKELQDEFGITRRRAELIANDQMGKLNGQLTQERQQSIGVDEYTWRGLLDERERQEHIDREGQRYKWTEPPADGHPGEPIRCRCYAEPVLPLFADLLAPTIPI